MSLVEDFKDRIPTQVLSNGAIRYEEFDENGNSLGYKYMKRADEPIEEGNVWNKTVYDGIKEELAKKMLISSKSTTEQAVEGIDDITYMTPLKTMKVIENGCKVVDNNIEVTTKGKVYSIDIDSYTNEKTLFVEITGYLENLSETIRWNAKDNSYIKGISFSSDGNNIFSEHENIYLSSEHSGITLKILADIENGVAFIFSCSYYEYSDSNIGSSGKFDKLMIVKFAGGTFGSLYFKNGSITSVANSTFEIKEYRKI